MSGFVKLPGSSDEIAREIAERGPMTFARFMELALYHPQWGYYTSGRAGVGRRGDFYTNVSVGAAFGKILAEQFREIWHRLGCPDRFPLVEQGAHDGQLAADILACLDEGFAAAAEYWIVEPSAGLRALQRETLAAHPGVRWFESVDALPRFAGVHFSNELVDALPFHLLRAAAQGWEELCVEAREVDFAFSPALPDPSLDLDLIALPVRAPGYLAECRPAARQWLRDLIGKMSAGVVLVIDYGFSRAQLLAPHRTEGTFSCYQSHRRDALPLLSPGEKDITAHVDFTALAETGLSAGWRLEGFTDQHHFLVGAAEFWLQELASRPLDAATQKIFRAVQTLLHPESMGTQFRYLALSLGLENSGPLSGFRHARDAATELFAPVI